MCKIAGKKESSISINLLEGVKENTFVHVYAHNTQVQAVDQCFSRGTGTSSRVEDQVSLQITKCSYKGFPAIQFPFFQRPLSPFSEYADQLAKHFSKEQHISGIQKNRTDQ